MLGCQAKGWPPILWGELAWKRLLRRFVMLSCISLGNNLCINTQQIFSTLQATSVAMKMNLHPKSARAT